MRVLEPSQLKRRSIKKKRRVVTVIKPLAVVVILLTAVGFLVWKMIAPKKIQSATTTPAKVESVNQVQQTDESPKKNQFKKFTNQQFVDFYSNFAYPNTAEITTPPHITSNPAADTRIQTLAVTRGYRLRSAPIAVPVNGADSYLIQQKAQQPLLDLIAAAKAKGMQITLTAAFRSVEEQRALFLSRLTANLNDIAAGTADASVIETLKMTAPPGYSRHHNGFTIDIACGDIGGLALLQTSCYQWLSADNFKNAKEFGWIPSYPEGATSVGPEPEPWELVWVGRDALLE